jgi:hypothetical protein
MRAEPIYGEQQWSDDDFGPIGQAIEDMFVDLGWRG